MKIIKVFFIVLAFFCARLEAQQDTVSLTECIKAANENAAIKPQAEIISEITELKIKNANISNLPSLSTFGKATYQSDAISIDFPPPGIQVDRFQYNLGVEANQKLFDGGIAAKNKELEKASMDAETMSIETELYRVNDRVTRYYFSCLLFDENKKVIELKESMLDKREEELEAGVRNGVIRQIELDKIKAEILSVRQQIQEIEKLKLQTLNALEIITGLTLSNDVIFTYTEDFTQSSDKERPETRYFLSEEIKIDKIVKLKSVQNMPKLYAFGQAGYSYPSLNMFENIPNYYYIVGAKLSWPLYDWKQVKREKQILQLQQDIVDTRRKDFEENNSIQLINEKIEQEKLLQMIELDLQIIEQRIKITTGSASSLANGVITASSYLEDLNAEMKARIDLETHKIQYQNSLVKAAILKGIDIDLL